MVHIDPDHPEGYAPLLAGAGAPSALGTPVYMGCELFGMACGALAADCFDDAAILRWVCVDEMCQGRGIGTRMLSAFCNLAAKAGAKRVDAVTCLPETDSGRVNRLLAACGFRREEKELTYSFLLSDLKASPLAGMAAKTDARVKRFPEVTKYQLAAFNRELAKSSGPLYPAIQAQDVLPESIAWVESSQITGCVLLAPCGDGLEIRWVYASGAQMLSAMLAAAYQAVQQKYPPETRLYAAALEPSADKILRTLIKHALASENPLVSYSKTL